VQDIKSIVAKNSAEKGLKNSVEKGLAKNSVEKGLAKNSVETGLAKNSVETGLRPVSTILRDIFMSATVLNCAAGTSYNKFG